MRITEKYIELEEFTGQENTTYNLNGAGLQVKEIAETMGITYETVKCYMKSIKTKLGLSKDKEITAHFFCKLMDKDFDEVKKQILASILLLIFICYIPFDMMQMRENRLTETRVRRSTVARRNDYPTSI